MDCSKLRFTLPLALAFLLGACGSSKDEPAAPKTSLATTTAGGLTLELLSDGPLTTGLTPLYLSVRTSAGAPVTDATVTWMPMMTMGHSAPMMEHAAVGADGLYRCDVVFQMASTAMDSWSMDVSVARGGAAAVNATFPNLAVTDGGRAKGWTDSATGTKYVASFGLHAAPAVGLNPVTVTLHRMVDMMTFAPVDDATLALDPQMPSMGHGAPGSVAPTLSASGVYEGKVAFSMPGTWETKLTVTRGGVAVGTPTFSITF